MSRTRLVLGLVLGISLLFFASLFLIWSQLPQFEDHLPVYNQLAKEHRTVEYTKPAPPKELGWDDRDRTGDYHAFLLHLESLKMEKSQTNKTAPIDQMWTRVDDLSKTGILAPECVALGLSQETPDAWIRSWSGQHCARLTSRSKEIETFVSLAESSYPSTPLSIWDAWHEKNQISLLSSSAAFHDLSTLALDRAYLDAYISGNLKPVLRTSIALFHLGEDMKRGASLISAMMGVNVQDRATRVLGRLAQTQIPLSDEHRQLLVASLIQIAQYPDTARLSFIADYLAFTGQLLPNNAGFDKPPEALNNTPYMDLVGENAMAPYTSAYFATPFFDMQGRLLIDLPDTFAKRGPALKEHAEASLQSSNPLIRIGSTNLRKFDTKIATQRTYVCMLSLVFSARSVLKRGEALTSLADLPKPVQDTCAEDPNSGEPVQLRVEDGVSYFVSSWANEDSQSDGSPRIEKQDSWRLRLPLETKPLPKSPAPDVGETKESPEISPNNTQTSP